MEQVCKYDPIRDIQKVDITGFVDLVHANASNSVPANIVADETKFNEIDDPNSIAGRPSDVFDAMQMNKSVLSYKAPESSANNAE